MKRFYYRHQPQASIKTALIAGLGAALVSLTLLALDQVLVFAVMFTPLAASSVLIFAVPHSPFSQPVNVVMGHVLAAAIGTAFHFALPGMFIGGALAIGLAISAMVILRVVHPPAGATALLAFLSANSWWFFLLPVGVGAAAMVLLATVYHQLTGVVYPNAVPRT